MSEDYWTPIEKKAFEAGEKKERARILSILKKILGTRHYKEILKEMEGE